MGNSSLVSIIVTSFNYENYIKQTIDSALVQTYFNFEVIVVDDGSTDNSPEIITSYGDKIISILKQNGGQGSAFNAGFKESKGDIVVFLDSDDVLMPQAVEKLVPLFNDFQVAKVHWPMYEIDEFGKRTGKLEPEFELATGNFKNLAISNGLDHEGRYQPPTSGNAWSRQFLNHVLPMPEAEYITCPDYYLFALVAIFGEFRTLQEPQGYYRVHGNNYSSKPLDKYMKELVKRYEVTNQILFSHLNDMGINVDFNHWEQNSWFHKINNSLKEMSDVIPVGSKFILANENHWKNNQVISGRKHIPFMEKNGMYYGLPTDDAAAIQEIENKRKDGVEFIVFSWTAYWLLDYYKRMYEYLQANYKCILNNERLIAFDLQLHFK